MPSRATSVVLRTSALRAVRSGVLWGALFGVLVANEAISYHSAFPTAESRTEFAEAFGHNSGMTAVAGPARHLDTVGGFVAWRMFSLLIVLAAVWGLFAATRQLRGEEDTGRWELVLSGWTGTRRATVQALQGLAVGFAVLFLLTGGALAIAGRQPEVGFSVGQSFYYALAATASAAMFLGIGAMASQLASNRRQANALGGLVLGAAYVIRLVADARTDLGWMRWLTPFGWVENLAPLTDPRPWALVPIVLLVALTVSAAIAVAGHRDIGAGLLGRAPSEGRESRLLTGPLGLAVTLERGVATAWILTSAALALVFGLVATAASGSDINDKAVGQTVGSLGGQGTGAAAWIGYEFLYLAALLAFAAAGQIGSVRSEEAGGQLDNLLSRPLLRSRWLAARLAVGAVLVLLAGLAAGLAGWLGVAGSGDIGLGEMVLAGLNIAVPSLVILGLGTLLLGLLPRLVGPVIYGVVLWSFVVAIVGTTITSNRLVLDTALFTHLAPLPAASFDWGATASLLAVAVVAAGIGFVTFRRRDVTSA